MTKLPLFKGFSLPDPRRLFSVTGPSPHLPTVAPDLLSALRQATDGAFPTSAYEALFDRMERVA